MAFTENHYHHHCHVSEEVNCKLEQILSNQEKIICGIRELQDYLGDEKTDKRIMKKMNRIIAQIKRTV